MINQIVLESNKQNMTWLKLNVGGHLIETQMSTLTKFPDSQLARQISSLQTPSSMDDDQDMKDANLPTTAVLNIDCDPDYFKIVLTWLR